MRNISAYITGLLAIIALGCTKDRPVVKPCNFEVSIDKVTGSKVEFTITPDKPNACYIYGVLTENYDQFAWTDEELVEWELSWRKSSYGKEESHDPAIGTFIDMYGYKGPRKFRTTRLTPDLKYKLYVFQVNPKTNEPVGKLYSTIFQTKAVPQVNLQFTIYCMGDELHIEPSDNEHSWFWEYERNDRIEEVYGDAYTFFYHIIDMYQSYDFLDNLLCRGAEDWVFSRDDPSLRDGCDYTLAIAGCEDGELTTDVYFATFSAQKGRIWFDENNSDIPIVVITEGRL